MIFLPSGWRRIGDSRENDVTIAELIHRRVAAAEAHHHQALHSEQAYAMLSSMADEFEHAPSTPEAWRFYASLQEDRELALALIAMVEERFRSMSALK